MKHTLIVIGCALALAGGSALAQQDTGKSQSSSQSGGGIVEKTKDAFHKLGESVKKGFHKAGDKVDSAKAKDNDGTKSMGAGAAHDKDASTHNERQQRMDSAYDDYKTKPSSSEPAKK